MACSIAVVAVVAAVAVVTLAVVADATLAVVLLSTVAAAMADATAVAALYPKVADAKVRLTATLFQHKLNQSWILLQCKT